MRLVVAIAVVLTGCGPFTEPPCPPECVVTWTERIPVPANRTPVVVSPWVYETHAVCDARCEHLGEPTSARYRGCPTAR
ncbi:MAG: hypothetical protein E6Q97_00165 [Desulfurellales bacterium]|nr:MAG: hypothetical protein E6Q97_00165 [Desulfurellales bacterium]